MIGLVGAFLLGRLADVVINSFARSRGVQESVSAFMLTPRLAITTMILSALFGLVVVYFPARRASRIDPIDATALRIVDTYRVAQYNDVVRKVCFKPGFVI